MGGRDTRFFRDTGATSVTSLSSELARELRATAALLTGAEAGRCRSKLDADAGRSILCFYLDGVFI